MHDAKALLDRHDAIRDLEEKSRKCSAALRAFAAVGAQRTRRPEHGYVGHGVPHLVSPETMTGTGQLPNSACPSAWRYGASGCTTGSSSCGPGTSGSPPA